MVIRLFILELLNMWVIKISPTVTFKNSWRLSLSENDNKQNKTKNPEDWK